MRALAAAAVHAIARATMVTIACFFLTFALFDALPGDAARALAGAQSNAADLARLRSANAGTPEGASYTFSPSRFVHRPRHHAGQAERCLDLALVHVDLGQSYVYRRPVRVLLEKRLGPSLALALAVATSCTALGVFLGFVAHGRGARRRVLPALRVVSAVPAFVLGLALHELLARQLGWLPLEAHLGTLGESARALVLPTLTLTLAMLGAYVAVAHARWRELAASAFVRAAEARGASAASALWRHGKRQVFAALVSMACLDAGLLVGGAVLTERLFRWPGLGSLAVEALLGRDVALLAGVVVTASTFVALATAVGEALRPLFDPRVRY